MEETPLQIQMNADNYLYSIYNFKKNISKQIKSK